MINKIKINELTFSIKFFIFGLSVLLLAACGGTEESGKIKTFNPTSTLSTDLDDFEKKDFQFTDNFSRIENNANSSSTSLTKQKPENKKTEPSNKKIVNMKSEQPKPIVGNSTIFNIDDSYPRTSSKNSLLYTFAGNCSEDFIFNAQYQYGDTDKRGGDFSYDVKCSSQRYKVTAIFENEVPESGKFKITYQVYNKQDQIIAFGDTSEFSKI